MRLDLKLTKSYINPYFDGQMESVSVVLFKFSFHILYFF